jgi:hypothetical protein
MRRVVNLAMRPELSLDVLITQNSHLGREMLPVSAEETAVEGDGREEGHVGWAEGTAGGGSGRGETD